MEDTLAPKLVYFFLFLFVISFGCGCDASTLDIDAAQNKQAMTEGVKNMTTDPHESAFYAVLSYFEAEGDRLSREEFDNSIHNVTVDSHPNLGEYYVYETIYGEFWINIGKKQILKYSKPPRFTVPEAKEYVEKYLESHVPDFKDRNFVQERSELEEPYWIEEYTEKPRGSEVSIFENWITISVNLDARGLQNFNFSDVRLVRQIPPKITESEVQNIIQQKYPQGQIKELHLMEYTTDGGKSSRTIWNATVLPDDDLESALDLITIDADSGEIIP